MLPDEPSTERSARPKKTICVMLRPLSFALLAITSCNVADQNELDYSPTFDLTDKQVFELLASLQSEAFSSVTSIMARDVK